MEIVFGNANRHLYLSILSSEIKKLKILTVIN